MEKLDDLMAAIRKGDKGEVERLLDRHPSLVRLRTEGGISMLLYALYHRQWEIGQVLRRHLRRIDIHEAAATGDLVELRRHLQAHPRTATAYTEDGFTPLGLASYFGQYEVAEELLARGAAINQPASNNFHVTPLHSAVAARNLSLARLLLSRGANVHAAQQAGITALHSAAHNGQIEMVELLLAAGADPCARTHDGLTPADLARAAGHQHLARRLAPPADSTSEADRT
ncbi:MAG: ankyrin repeat domain-containing protein [Bacteroidia bacterium]